MIHANRFNVTLSPAAHDDNFGKLWYVQIGHRCIAMIHHDDTPEEVRRIIDSALAILNAQTDEYMATI